MSLFSELVTNHGLDLATALRYKERATLYEEFDDGIVMLVPGVTESIDLLFTVAKDNHYSTSMWRLIRKILKRRKNPIYMQYTTNYHILFKASKRYGAVELYDGVVIFP